MMRDGTLPSSTDDLAGLEALMDSINRVRSKTDATLCRMNICLVDSVVPLNPLGLLGIHIYLVNCAIVCAN